MNYLFFLFLETPIMKTFFAFIVLGMLFASFESKHFSNKIENDFPSNHLPLLKENDPRFRAAMTNAQCGPHKPCHPANTHICNDNGRCVPRG